MTDVVPAVKQYVLDQYLPGENPANLTLTTPLVSGGILDSLAILDLVAYLEKTFGIELEAHEVDRDRLDTLERIAALVNGKLGRS
ncbi:MAG: acyl carrier protein [Gemmatimonadota bacterium]|nr:acyl carrier protein [Gemmatimonadota bacterium]MDH5283468.1 acyl carrier protein [Gemmatimonadota bacterium]